MWISRDLEPHLEQNNELVQILIGPRQVGKSSLLEHISSDYKVVTFDDPVQRDLAREDPALFLKHHGQDKLLIDEAQYVPSLFPVIKQKIDRIKKDLKQKSTLIRLTGSNQILFDKAVKEGLTGRASYFWLNTLSFTEIQTYLPQIKATDFLYRGGHPELYAFPETNHIQYLNSYINSYIEKDIVLSAGIKQSARFLKCLRYLAGLSGELFNASKLGNSLGIDASTVSHWVSTLERMGIIALVPAYSSNMNKRLSKQSKLYFLDTGLACRLQGWTSVDPFLHSPQFGPVVETLIHAEIRKFSDYRQKHWKIYHWRTRDGLEADFLIDLGNQHFVVVEGKVSSKASIGENVLKEVQRSLGASELVDSCICHLNGDEIMPGRVPVRLLSDWLSRLS